MKGIQRCNRKPKMVPEYNCNQDHFHKPPTILEMDNRIYTIEGHNTSNLPPPTYEEAIYNLQQRSATPVVNNV